MKSAILNGVLLSILITFAFFPTSILSDQPKEKMDIFAGYFAREGNNESPSVATQHNIYIKLFENQWIVMLYVPLEIAENLKPTSIDKALEEAKKKTNTSAYIRDTFGILEERAIATIEKYGYIEDTIVFECNSLAPCTIKLKDGYLEFIKPGIINEHIIKYNHVIDHLLHESSE